MSENVGGSNIFGSGGHTWQWGSEAVNEKVLATAGTTGAVGMVTSVGGCPVKITGLLKADNAAALIALIQAIKTLTIHRTVCAWEDDLGQTGDALVLMDLTIHERVHGATTTDAWARYTCTGDERQGGPYG